MSLNKYKMKSLSDKHEEQKVVVEKVEKKVEKKVKKTK